MQIENLLEFTRLIEDWQGDLGNYLELLKEQYPEAVTALNLFEQAFATLPYEAEATITTDFYD